jgi:hypothetical protein
MKYGAEFSDWFENKHVPIFTTPAAYTRPQQGVTSSLLRKVWRISLGEVKQTLQVTAQLNKPDAGSGSWCCFSTNNRILIYKRIYSLFYMVTLFNTVKSKSDFAMMQLFVSDKGFVKFY